MVDQKQTGEASADAELRSIRARRHKEGCPCPFCERMRRNYLKGLENPRDARGLTRKKRVFVRGFTDPGTETFGNATQAAVKAGYSPHSAGSIGSQLLKDGQTKRAIVTAFEKVGITEDFISQRIKEGLLAEEVRYFADKGQVVDERREPDHYVRHKFVETTMRARGDFPREEPQQLAALIVNLGDESLSEDDWNKKVAEIKANQQICQHCGTEHPSTYNCLE